MGTMLGSGVPVVLFVALCLLQIPPVISDANTNITFECPERFVRQGSECLLLVDVPMNNLNAEETCKSYGSSLVHIRDEVEAKNVGYMVHTLQPSWDLYWIGNLVHDEEEACSGFWDVGEPKDESVNSTIYVAATSQGRWREEPKEMWLPFVCKTDACVEGTFRCRNGEKCLSNKWKCDNVFDCYDQSDEDKCESECTYYHRDASGMLDEFSGYSPSRTCTWVIEGPPGHPLSIEFTDLDVEEDVDFVEVWSGSPSIVTSRLQARLTGMLTSNRKVYGYNNFLIVRLVVDSSIEISGFRASWEQDDELSHRERDIVATDAWQELKSPYYDSERLPTAYVRQFTVTTDEGSLITMEVMENELGEDFHYDSDTLSKITGGNFQPATYVSMSNRFTFYLISNGCDGPEKFRARVRKGCAADVTGSNGFIRPPTFGDPAYYPPSVECQYLINAPEDNPQPFQILFTELALADGRDSLKVFDGSNSSAVDVTPAAVDTVSASSSSPVLAVFKSSLVQSEGFFSLTFNLACPPITNDDHMMMSTTDVQYGSVVTLSCDVSFAFEQEEYTEETEVIISCGMGGKWNVTRLPTCAEIYCGVPEAIDNGYIADGSGSARYNATVTYSCFGGFEISGSNVSTCGDGSQWSNPPTCEATACGPAADLPAGNYTIVNGNGTEYSSVVEYHCYEGYEEVGPVISVCQRDGTWFPSAPLCQRIKCPVPDIDTSVAMLNVMEPVEFEGSLTVNCTDGFVISGTNDTSKDYECPGSRDFGIMYSVCVDFDECQLVDSCTGDHQVCKNTVGSYMCECEDKYRKNGTECEVIDQCVEGTSGCDLDNGYCMPLNGGEDYECRCNEGYLLFTENGTSGRVIPPPEDGFTPGDVYRINHTCVPKTCGPPPMLNNGTVLTARMSFDINETVENRCDFGFRMPDNSTSDVLTCQGDDIWDKSPADCERISCGSLEATGLVRNIYPNGTYYAHDEITLECYSQSEERLYNKTLFCAYDTDLNTFRLQGDNPHCPAIDCGNVTVIGGALFTAPSSTGLGASFVFGCQLGFEKEGNSTTGDDEVFCERNGRWGLGNLTCSGARCLDPGTPGGMTLTITNFEVDSTVYYTCDRAGFEANPSARACTFNSTDNTTYWDRTQPVCEDVQLPEFTNCPNDTIKLKLYSNPRTEISIPEATDNSGLVKVTVSPPGFTSDMALDQGTYTVIFTASDAPGHSVPCNVTVEVNDPSTLPELSCPDYLSLDVNSTSYDFDLASEVSADNDSTLSFSPGPIVSVMSSAVGKNVYRVTATNGYGFYRQCAFIVDIQPAVCLQDYIASDIASKNAEVTCNGADGGTLTCNVTCKDGYSFQDSTMMMSYSCQGMNEWTPRLPARTCGAVLDIAYRYEVDVLYALTEASDITDCEDELRTELEQRIPQQSFSCSGNPADMTSFSVSSVVFSTANSLVKKNAAIYLVSNSTSKCNDLLSSNTAANLFSVSGTTFSCDGKNSYSIHKRNQTFKGDTEVCYAGYLLVNDSSGRQCVPCEPGYYLDGGECKECADGTYQDKPAQEMCKACPGNVQSYLPRVSESQCDASCPAGFYNDSSSSRCHACAEDSYQSTPFSSSCMNCSEGTTTSGVEGAYECQAECDQGFYATNNTGCEPCPLGYYKSVTGNMACEPCGANETTADTGTISQTACVPVPQLIMCRNGGDSTIDNHIEYCDCPDGYSGPNCDDAVDACLSSPCYNGGECSSSSPDSFTCDCPRQGCTFEDISLDHSPDYLFIQSGVTVDECKDLCLDSLLCKAFYADNSPGTFYCVFYNETTYVTGDGFSAFLKECPDQRLFEGDRCETDAIDNCVNSTCYEISFCRDLNHSAVCVCPEDSKYRPPSCEPDEDLCASNPCDNSATCVSIGGGVRFTCICPPGFTGDLCETDIDECKENPDGCLYGGTCQNLSNDYECTCPDAYDGDHCEIIPDYCTEQNMCANGLCYNDYDAFTPVCVCEFPYTVDGTGHECDAINVCSMNDPCEHNSSCISEGPGMASCQCQPGYNGSLCQTDIDECSSNPCVKGKCVNQVNNFTCECEPGFEGVLCDEDIDGCLNHSCVENNYDACQNLPLGYRCNCSAGFMGQYCEININECLSLPCQHNGSCTESSVPGEYNCTCVNGWTGTSCEKPIDFCDPNPCNNSGSCFSLEDNFFCACEGGTFGETCEVATEVCSILDPCTPDSNCEEVDGNAQCACPMNYTGGSCNLIKDGCSDDPCGSNGSCILHELGYSCKCADGYSGEGCTEKADPCETVTCPYESTCIVKDEEAKCECMDKTNGVCKEMTSDFDIYFQRPDKQICSNKTFSLSEREMAIMVWVAPLQETDEAIVELKYSDDTPVLTLDMESVTFGSESPVPMQGNSGNKKYELESWNHVTVNWISSGNYEISLSGYKLTGGTTTATFPPLNTPISICIGGNFTGYISQLYIWQKSLTYDEILDMYDDPDTIKEDGLVKRWGAYHLSENLWAQLLFPSKAERLGEICAGGQTGSDCDNEPDKEPPSLPECPSDQTFDDVERLVQITDAYPSGDALSNLPGTILTFGAHRVVYMALDDQMNVNFCRFNAYIKRSGQSCNNTEGLNPDNIVPCESEGQKVQCPANSMAPMDPKILTCGKLGSYNLDNSHQLPPAVICGSVGSRKVKLTLTMVYQQSFACASGDGTDLSNAVLERIKTLNSNWSNLCVNATCGNVVVSGKCVSSTSENVTITVTFNSLPSTLTHAGVTLTPRELILTATKEMDSFNIDYLNGAELQTDTVKPGEEEGMCDPGFGLKDGICVECAEGSFLNETTGMCQKCPIGSYTDQSGETSCTPCSDGETTLQIGAHYCNISCDRGQYLDDDGQCQPCEKNFYQDQTGQIMCFSCPAGTATETTGADDAILCVDTCDPGTELKNQSCVPCPRGYFRDGVTEEQETCEECPMGNTTKGTGSTSHTRCDQAACDPGYSRNPTLNQCEVCDYDYFQPEKWQDSCEKCNESYTTNNTGSTSPDQCLFVCPAGEESLGGLSCTECERGFYRTDSMEDRFVNCIPCNETFTTSGEGSKFAEDCNIRVCEAGSYRNETDNTCNLCPYGTFQPDSLATECITCPDNTTTEEIGRNDSSQCIFYCPSGYEVLSAESQTCRACERGYFKTNNGNDVFDMCERCPDSNTTTDSEASTSVGLCIVPVCEAGQEVSGTDCVDCPEDKFQPVNMPKTTDTCEKCPDGKGTMEPKQTSDSACEFYCGPGEQYDQQNSRCEPCPMGTWNTGNNSQRFEPCAECTPGYVTENEMTGANSPDLCTLRDCPAGEFIDGDDCTACAVGYYQDVPRQTSCKECRSNTNTTGGGHDNANDCTIYCPAGQTQDPQTNDTCVPCEEDFFKDYAGYGECDQCTGNFTSGSSRTDCSVPFCDKGYETDNNGNCLPCEAGKYKDIRGNNDSCTPCPTNTTTSEQASTMQSQCDQAYCDLGFYSPDDSLPCLPCSVGYFKNTTGNDNCTQCDMDFTTEGVASTAESDCFVVVCPTGHFRNSSNQCESCPIGEYQDEVGRPTCKECDVGYITTSVGSDSEDNCRIICVAGKFRNDTTNTCMNCPRGSYQDKTGEAMCEDCGAQYTTAGEASTEEVACYIICLAGQYSSTRTDCEQCPHGQFQGSPGSSSCENCTLGDTTLQLGSQSSDDCMPICDRGEYLDTSTKMCELCDFGTYNPDAGTTTTAVTSCQNCRTGNTTTIKGATDESQCNITDCGPGSYRANEGCELCDYGYYQPERSQMSCMQCPAVLTTLLKGRFENTSCVDTCPDGEEYNLESGVCEQCLIGYYRKAVKSQPSCQKCPPDKTTLTQGADACIDESSGTTPKPPKKITVTVEVIFRIEVCNNPVQVGNAIIDISFGVLTRTAGTYPRLCTSNCGNAAVSFKGGCLQGFNRRKRSTGSEQEVEVTVNDVYNEIKDNTTEIYYQTEAVIRNAFYELQPEKDLLEANQLAFVRVSDVEVETLCQPGEERDGSSCSACEAGTYSSDGSACSMCEMDTYQNSTGQALCLRCPALTFTTDRGAVEVSNCTRKCQQPNARETYCNGHGACMFDATATDGVRCVCDDSYEGDDCEKRKDSTNDKTSMIVGIACGSAAFLLLLLLIVGVVACLKRAAKKGKKKQTNGTHGVSGYTNSLAYADDGVSERYVDYNYPLYDNGMRAMPAGPAIMYMNPETSDQDVRDFYLPDKSSNPPSRTRSRSYESEWKDFEATM